jgi:hypothetical protein
MPRFSLLLFAIGCTLAGCGSAERLSVKVDRMEKDLSDMRRVQSQMNQRMDELQIQLSLLQRRFAEKPASLNDVQTEGGNLKLVRLHPATKNGGERSPNKNESGSLSASPRVVLPRVDPKAVQEHLAVDVEAAKRPLMGP